MSTIRTKHNATKPQADQLKDASQMPPIRQPDPPAGYLLDLCPPGHLPVPGRRP